MNRWCIREYSCKSNRYGENHARSISCVFQHARKTVVDLVIMRCDHQALRIVPGHDSAFRLHFACISYKALHFRKSGHSFCINLLQYLADLIRFKSFFSHWNMDLIVVTRVIKKLFILKQTWMIKYSGKFLTISETLRQESQTKLFPTFLHDIFGLVLTTKNG